MNRQQNIAPELPQKWEKSQLQDALKLARILAAKAARKRRIAAADRDDLIQDILLALLQASAHFDPARGSWGGFVTIIARRAIADQARRPSAPPSISLDSKEAAGILRSLAAPAHDPEAHLAMTRAADEMPEAQRALLRSIFTHRDIAATRAATRKGTPASTIHSLIYRVSEATPEEIARVEKELFDLQRSLGRMGYAERAFAETQIRRLELRLADIHRPTFLLNEQSRLRDASLLVLDEVSMVGEEMAADLLAFGKPILVLGDPGQLPPIKGTGAFTMATPDIMLTEIHRQAEESAIIRLATMARQGIEIPPGAHDAHVWKMPRRAVGPEQMLRGGQVICGRNNTRLWLNSQMKAAAGFPFAYPQGCDEKIICLKNRHDLGLINGMFVTLRNIEDDGPLSFRASVTTEDGDEISGRHRFYKGHYDEHIQRDPERERRDWRDMRGMIETSWGYAITCHKAQGSSWPNVIVYDDQLSRTEEDRKRWLYTAITRAERGLVILD